MAVCEIITNPANKILRKKTEFVDKVDKKALAILDDMAETLRNTGGNGLAAPQIGVSLRLIIVKLESNYMQLINPVIVKTAGEQYSLEGCLSLPGIHGIVRRPEFALIHALDTKVGRMNSKPCVSWRLYSAMKSIISTVSF